MFSSKYCEIFKNIYFEEHLQKTASDAATQRYSMKRVFWKYAANLHESNHPEVYFQ